VKSALGTGSESMEIDRRVYALAWRRKRAKPLLGVTPPWIEDSQSKVVHILTRRRHLVVVSPLSKVFRPAAPPGPTV
jgi:hypothetical protein